MKSAYSPPSKDVGKLRTAAGLEDETITIKENYLCVECDNFIYIDDCKSIVKNWCDDCSKVKCFTHIDSERTNFGV